MRKKRISAVSLLLALVITASNSLAGRPRSLPRRNQPSKLVTCRLHMLVHYSWMPIFITVNMGTIMSN